MKEREVVKVQRPQPLIPTTDMAAKQSRPPLTMVVKEQRPLPPMIRTLMTNPTTTTMVVKGQKQSEAMTAKVPRPRVVNFSTNYTSRYL